MGTVKSSWVFYLGRGLFRFLFAVLGRWEIAGHENVPESGGMIVASNHISWFDPPLVGSALKRPLHFMAKKELFDIPVLGFLIKRTNAFPVRRGQQDINAIRTAKKLLHAGELLIMFPEGTRSKDGSFGKARAGIGMVACMAGVPVLPVRVVNSNNLFKFRKIRVIFGKPVPPPTEHSKEAYQAFSEKVLEEIKKL